MKRLFAHICLILFGTVSLLAQTADNYANTLKQGNALYKEGHYSDAALLYEQALKNGVSPELYYNLGNAYYKSGELGKSILNYERALRLKPFYEDAQYNLGFVRQKAVDNITATPGFFVKKWINTIIDSLSTNYWAFLSIFLFILMLAATLVFAFHPLRKMRKFAFYLAFFSLFLVAITFIFSGVKKDRMVRHNDAIVMTGIVTAKSSPDKSGTDLFQLHEGTKVHIKSVIGKWAEIQIENNAVGWIEENNAERI